MVGSSPSATEQFAEACREARIIEAGTTERWHEWEYCLNPDLVKFTEDLEITVFHLELEIDKEMMNGSREKANERSRQRLGRASRE